MVGSEYAYDQKPRRSLTGMIEFVGSTPVLWMGKRQGDVAFSTYVTEVSTMRTSIEEYMSSNYMIRCLGCNISSDISYPTKIFNDNISVILNSQSSSADLSKKHVVISCNVLIGAIAAGIIEYYWLNGKYIIYYDKADS